MLSLVLDRHASSPDLVGVYGSAEGSLELDDERRAAGGADLDLVPTSGAPGTIWSCSSSAPDASGAVSSTQTQTTPIRRYAEPRTFSVLGARKSLNRTRGDGVILWVHLVRVHK